MPQLSNLDLSKHILSKETDYLSSTEKLVALALLSHRNNRTFKCCPGVTRMHMATGLGKSTVLRSIKSLIDKNFIVRLKIGGEKKMHHYKSWYYFIKDIGQAKTIFNDDDAIIHYNDECVENFQFCLDNGLF